MSVTVACVGKVKERFYRDAAAEYVKRLGSYCRLTIAEVADEKTPDHASPGVEKRILDTEGARLLKVIPADAWVIALAIDGRTMDSVAFGEHMAQLGLRGNSHVAFVIGGSLGLSPDVLARANEALSFSAMTFPHQLMRVILLEQIYRGFRIVNGQPYHK